MASSSEVPNEPPPSYQAATGSSNSSSRPQNPTSPSSSHLGVPGSSSNGISIAARRSMEDLHRPLPDGWVRTFDPESNHQFFVDTTKDPPRSIWTHPYDDEEYLRTLSGEERERIEQESMNRGKNPSKADIMASHTDEEDDDEHHTHASTRPVGSSSSGAYPSELPPRTDGKGKGKDTRSFGRKFKDKITGSTHEEREAERRQRAEQERRAYEQHQRVRQAMTKAMQTGDRQLVGKDSNGKDVYVEPPPLRAGPAGFGYDAPPGMGYNRGYGYPGAYGAPAGYYARPAYPYNRPYGGGFGGGYGLPLALGGGLLGGLLLGDALGGF